MSEAREISLGQRYHQQVIRQMPPYGDHALAAYVEAVGQRLARVSDRPGLSWHFTVLDNREVNAFALPGGYIYVNRGLLAYLNSEAELAAVLGHEIGHVTARHAVRQHSARTVTNVASMVLQATTGIRATGDLANILGQAVLSGYGREHELEADRLGARYLARAGYDPQAMIEVIGVLKNQELFEKQLAREEGRAARVYHGVFASHPDNDRRLQEVVSEAGRLHFSDNPQLARDAFLPHLEGLAYGDSEANGVVRKNLFLHKPLDFGLRFPEGWTLQNQPERLLATAPGKKAWLELRLERLQPGQSLPDFLTAKGFKPLRNGHALQIAGHEAWRATSTVGTRFGRRTARLIVIRDGEQAFLFVGIGRESNDFERFDIDFLATARSFHPLNKEERDLAEGLHLHLITARADTRFAELARRSPLPDHAQARLRLLNGLYPDGEPQPGQRLKIVR
ncbi:MAG TPA: peptidase M48 Ste24p [Gammaproteobacteria bacterium]|nr:peptidase M48 Ste24p [Gammaproteobacteria bacterium]